MSKKFLAVVLLVVCLAVPTYAADESISIFIAYTGIKPILEAFTRDTGIKVDYLEMSSGEVLTRIRAAKGKTQADAWFGGGLDSYVAAANEGFLEAYISPERSVYDPMFYNAEGLWSGISLGSVVLMGNKEILTQKNLSMPQSWEDLTKPEYKDEVLMATPAVSGTFYAMVSGIVQTMGSEDGWKRLEAIDANVPYYSKRGAEPANKVSIGEAAIAVAPFDTVQRLQQEGYNVEMTFPKDGVPWYIAPVAIFKGANNPAGARALVDWVLSEKGQTALGEYNTQAPIRPGVKLAPAVQAMRDSNLMRMDVVKAGQDREEILGIWLEKFGNK
ncbi:MAG: ABC transporter substrate-binding protein [Synergistaceae bacterium]|nr:ABC transporter substrate-binding protein [Synergistaceae bacterium]MBR0075963.1 ABC transporter substrate-binding protein [Synergistaceae bacterium]